MAKKNNAEKSDIESRIKLMEKRLSKLENQVEKKLNRPFLKYALQKLDSEAPQEKMLLYLNIY